MIVLYRPGVAADLDFILSSWLRSCRNRHYFDAWDNDAYYNDASGFQAWVKAVLRRPETVQTIACPDDDEGQILGYAVTGPNVLHYVYVKQPFRKGGIAKGLVGHALPRCGREVCDECNAIGSLRLTGRIITRPDGVLADSGECRCSQCSELFESRHAAMAQTMTTQTAYGWRELSERFRLVFNPWA